jgi:hypothetical protein
MRRNPLYSIDKGMLLLLITMNCVATSALAAEAKTLQVQRTDIHVDSARPLAGCKHRSESAAPFAGRNVQRS